MKDDYIEAARARGIDERSVVYHHAFRNALVPVITVVGLQSRSCSAGAVLTETTFNWPGIGHELVRYLENRDYTAVQGIIIVFALVVVVVEPDHRLRQRVHRPEDPLLMATPRRSRRRPRRREPASPAFGARFGPIARGARA